MKILEIPQDAISYNVKAGRNFFKTKREEFSSYKNLDRSPLTEQQKTFLKLRGFNTLIVGLADDIDKKIKNVPIFFVEGNMIIPEDKYGLTEEALNQIQVLGTQFGQRTAGIISYNSCLARVLDSDGAWLKNSNIVLIDKSPCATVTESPGAKVTESLWAKVTESLWAKVTESPGATVTESPGATVTESQWAKVTESPCAKVTESPCATVTESPCAKVKNGRRV